MSRGGGGGARGGRGRGAANRTFNRDQFAAMGVTNIELLPTLVTQPPPIFPPTERRPAPLPLSQDIDYLLILRQDLIDHSQLSAVYIQSSGGSEGRITSIRPKYDWGLMPAELRPKKLAKRQRVSHHNPVVDIEKKLDALERIEQTKEIRIKQEAEDVEEEEVQFDEEDEEMDDGTDYANNYFDNGEGYEDDDDNMDEGPIF